MIEQGVMIEQKEIRFDDFVALNCDQVPLPGPDHSMAVSYGLIEIPFSRKRDERATHYLEIALRASGSAPAEYPVSQAPSVNYVFVVDASGSMFGRKLDAVKTSLWKLFSQMRQDDVIGIIEFWMRAETRLQATRVGDSSSYEVGRIMSDLVAGGSTDINLGLSFGIDEMYRYADQDNMANYIYLFSDGNPTSGETDWLRIRQNVLSRTRGLSIHISPFAFGSDANVRELDRLAGMTGGTCTFVIDPSALQLNLEGELSRRDHLAAINIQMNIEIDQDVLIYHLYGHDQVVDPVTREAVWADVETAKRQAEEEYDVEAQPDIVTQDRGIRIFVPDLAVGETYWVVLELGIPEGRELSPLGKATVQYVDILALQNERHEFELSLGGELPSDLVVQHALGLWTSEVVFYALDDLYEEDLETARTRIERHISLLSSANDALSSDQLTDDIITLRKLLSVAQNLGKVMSLSDEPVPGQTLLVHSLNVFGRVRNGFNRVDYSSGP